MEAGEVKQVQQQLEILSESVEELNKKIIVLIDRLRPVLRSGAEEVKEEDREEKYLVPLADEIRKNYRTLEVVNQRLSDLFMRIEI